MSQLINATFEDGVFKPDRAPSLPAGARVRLIVDEPAEAEDDAQAAVTALDELCDELAIDSAGDHLTRDQLHERR